MEAAPEDYALLDAGDGRRLERFGEIVLDRPAPAPSAAPRRDPAAWTAAHARFERDASTGTGAWLPPGALPPAWSITVDDLELELRATPAGGVGFFPEHVAVARWAAGRAEALALAAGRPPLVLNLFAHTGLATLAVARAGAAVAHVDASRPALAWARHNAERSGLLDRPIRWLVDDAGRFVAREARRGRGYDGVLLDPPTYGHGPRGLPWRLEEGLAGLLTAVRGILAPERWFVACTAHATGLDGAALEAIVRSALEPAPGRTELRELVLASPAGARLAAGWAVLAAADSPGTPS